MRSHLVHHLLENSAKRYSDKIAVKHENRVITFQELLEESTKMATLLRTFRIGRGERVGILLDKSIEQIISFLGISYSGGVSVFINPILKKEQVEHIIRDCEAKALICTRRVWEKNKIDMPIKIICMDGTGNKETWKSKRRYSLLV